MSAAATTGGGNRPKAGEVASGMAASSATFGSIGDVLAHCLNYHPLDIAAQRAIEGHSPRRIPVSRYKAVRS